MKYSFCYAVLIALALLRPFSAWTQTRVACWNVENFFDTHDDTLTHDDEFTPEGENHWTIHRFFEKRDNIYKTIAAMDFPVLFGLVEVENDNVLDELCLGTPLRRMDYGYVHYDSPDPRGIDCALIYRRDLFRPTEQRPLPMSDSAAGYFTRDVLLVSGVLSQGDTLYVLINHWPSQLGGVRAADYRARIARRLFVVMDSLHTEHPQAWVVAMGDFNTSPHEVGQLLQRFYEEGVCQCPRALMTEIADSCASYKHQGRWTFLDQILYYASQCNSPCGGGVFVAPWLVTDDKRYLGTKPFRTYRGPVYQGGVSDHLPIYLDFLCEE